jgi:hypothetical protein
MSCCCRAEVLAFADQTVYVAGGINMLISMIVTGSRAKQYSLCQRFSCCGTGHDSTIIAATSACRTGCSCAVYSSALHPCWCMSWAGSHIGQPLTIVHVTLVLQHLRLSSTVGDSAASFTDCSLPEAACIIAEIRPLVLRVV